MIIDDTSQDMQSLKNKHLYLAIMMLIFCIFLTDLAEYVLVNIFHFFYVTYDESLKQLILFLSILLMGIIYFFKKSKQTIIICVFFLVLFNALLLQSYTAINDTGIKRNHFFFFHNQYVPWSEVSVVNISTRSKVKLAHMPSTIRINPFKTVIEPQIEIHTKQHDILLNDFSISEIIHLKKWLIEQESMSLQIYPIPEKYRDTYFLMSHSYQEQLNELYEMKESFNEKIIQY
ncbi:hypothetical protein AAGS61_13440 [Lysinibacillus sp. KU-BSD001]|uniref:hypothetical protein n=1 Tax=Lysinibacillus sp. KU-BSD001 TaxID=3141328 RepID=UPI0036F01975